MTALLWQTQVICSSLALQSQNRNKATPLLIMDQRTTLLSYTQYGPIRNGGITARPDAAEQYKTILCVYSYHSIPKVHVHHSISYNKAKWWSAKDKSVVHRSVVGNGVALFRRRDCNVEVQQITFSGLSR